MLGGSGGGKGTWRRTVEGEKKWIRWSNQAEEGQQRASVMEGLPLSPASLSLSLSLPASGFTQRTILENKCSVKIGMFILARVEMKNYLLVTK